MGGQLENKIDKRLSPCTTQCLARRRQKDEKKNEKDREPRRCTTMGGTNMEKVYERCCGINIHKKVVVACMRMGKKKELREYGTSTRELLMLSD